MTGFLRKVLRGLTVLVLLVLAAYGGWLWGPEVFPRVHEWLGRSFAADEVAEEASPELADAVVARVHGLRDGQGEGRLAFGGSELTSVLRYSVPGLLPDGVSDPRVTLKEGRVQVEARVALEAFPNLPDLGPILGILPDTLDVAVEASLMPFSEGRAALLVYRVEASRIPLPRRMIPDILEAMGRSPQPGLPPEALLVPLPRGLGSAYILTDSLILSTDS